MIATHFPRFSGVEAYAPIRVADLEASLDPVARNENCGETSSKAKTSPVSENRCIVLNQRLADCKLDSQPFERNGRRLQGNAGFTRRLKKSEPAFKLFNVIWAQQDPTAVPLIAASAIARAHGNSQPLWQAIFTLIYVLAFGGQRYSTVFRSAIGLTVDGKETGLLRH
jgi:hypothetical protein